MFPDFSQLKKWRMKKLRCYFACSQHKKKKEKRKKEWKKEEAQQYMMVCNGIPARRRQGYYVFKFEARLSYRVCPRPACTPEWGLISNQTKQVETNKQQQKMNSIQGDGCQGS